MEPLCSKALGESIITVGCHTWAIASVEFDRKTVICVWFWARPVNDC